MTVWPFADFHSNPHFGDILVTKIPIFAQNSIFWAIFKSHRGWVSININWYFLQKFYSQVLQKLTYDHKRVKPIFGALWNVRILFNEWHFWNASQTIFLNMCKISRKLDKQSSIFCKDKITVSLLIL